MLYALLYPRLAPPDAAAVDRLRARFEPERARLVRPHVTLVFGVTAVGEGDLAGLCRSAAARQRPFALGLAGAEGFRDPVDGRHKVVLIVREGAEEVTALHEALYAGPHRGSLRRDIPFRPHLTVATCDTAEEARDALAEAAKLAYPIGGDVDAVVLERLTDGELRTSGTFPFR